MDALHEYFEIGMKFHGHKCPAMPLGLRVGLAAMEALGVARAQNKELVVDAETGKGHAAGCFVDGIMTATGCTYGKGNMGKLYYGKMAFTLTDVPNQRAVRVSVKPEFFEKALHSPFVEQRRRGVPPQDVPDEVVTPLVDRILGLPVEEFLDIGEVHDVSRPVPRGVFETRRCARCGEATFVNSLRVGVDGDLVCVPCSGYDA